MSSCTLCFTKTVSNIKVRTLNTFYNCLKDVNKTIAILPREFEARENLYCKEHICLVIKMLELPYLFRKLILKWYNVDRRTSSSLYNYIHHYFNNYLL